MVSRLVVSHASPFLVPVTYIGPQIVTYIGPQVVTYIRPQICIPISPLSPSHLLETTRTFGPQERSWNTPPRYAPYHLFVFINSQFSSYFLSFLIFFIISYVCYYFSWFLKVSFCFVIASYICLYFSYFTSDWRPDKAIWQRTNEEPPNTCRCQENRTSKRETAEKNAGVNRIVLIWIFR